MSFDQRQTKQQLSEQSLAVGKTLFLLDQAGYSEFVARFEAPPNPNERLRQTMQTTAPWEK